MGNDAGGNPDSDLLMRGIAALVAVLTVCSLIGAIVMFTFVDVRAANKEIVLGLIGSLTLAFGTIIGYLYGRSSTSDMSARVNATRDTVAVTTSAPAPPPAAPVPTEGGSTP